MYQFIKKSTHLGEKTKSILLGNIDALLPFIKQYLLDARVNQQSINKALVILDKTSNRLTHQITSSSSSFFLGAEAKAVPFYDEGSGMNLMELDSGSGSGHNTEFSGDNSLHVMPTLSDTSFISPTKTEDFHSIKSHSISPVQTKSRTTEIKPSSTPIESNPIKIYSETIPKHCTALEIQNTQVMICNQDSQNIPIEANLEDLNNPILKKTDLIQLYRANETFNIIQAVLNNNGNPYLGYYGNILIETRISCSYLIVRQPMPWVYIPNLKLTLTQEVRNIEDISPTLNMVVNYNHHLPENFNKSLPLQLVDIDPPNSNGSPQIAILTYISTELSALASIPIEKIQICSDRITSRFFTTLLHMDPLHPILLGDIKNNANFTIDPKNGTLTWRINTTQTEELLTSNHPLMTSTHSVELSATSSPTTSDNASSNVKIFIYSLSAFVSVVNVVIITSLTSATTILCVKIITRKKPLNRDNPIELATLNTIRTTSQAIQTEQNASEESSV